MPQQNGTGKSRNYRFASGVTLRIHTLQEEFREHFDGEYARAAGGFDGEADIEVYAGSEAIAASANGLLNGAYEGRHKVVRWKVAVAGIGEQTTRVAFEGTGSLVISFLQTFYIEPLLRLKTAARDHALVHAATLNKDDRSVLFPAGSAVGKSTMMLQHAAAGNPVQGDNYVILTPDGRTLAFPRRMRIYSDLIKTNPKVYGLLPGRERFRLRLAGLVRTLSAGYANMPRRLSVDEIFGDSRLSRDARLESVCLLSAYTGEGLEGPLPRSTDETIARIQTINDAECVRLRTVLEANNDEPSLAVMAEASSREREVLERALNGVPAFELRVPRVRDPAPLVAQIRRVTGLDTGA
jgi:hypothetical protein